MDLLIVESPAKAKTISKFLGAAFKVDSTFGHIRDLPKSKMAIDIKNNFEPQYVIPRPKFKIISNLKKLAKTAQKIYFATDKDREGEAIAWHLAHILNIPINKTQRIVFHEITQNAVKEAIKEPRNIDLNMVNAQQARRILDRLVGYELSPFLWRKIAKGLSAGRVQSAALRLIVEREKEIENFIKQEYWSVEGQFESAKKTGSFIAKLHQYDNQAVGKLDLKSENDANKIVKNLQGKNYSVFNISQTEIKRTPPPPFLTSTLQQEANKKFGFSAKQTMLFAQQLYEGIELGSEGPVGLITYMRTDSVSLSEKFLSEAGKFIKENYGDTYVPSAARIYQTKSKVAQEAHEAIRPADISKMPTSIKQYLNAGQYKLYDLIWRRALASQFPNAVVLSTTIDIQSDDAEIPAVFRANGATIKFDGFLKIYPLLKKENILPKLSKNENVNLLDIKGLQHFTEPPARYSDATLVKALEENGIGRPSTYAPIISTIIERGYAERLNDKKLQPKEIALLVNDLLVKHFPKIVDYKFTARMEDGLDDIAKGELEWTKMLKEFYEPFKKNLLKKEKEIAEKPETQVTDEICRECGKPLVIRTSRYGKFLACSGFPKCKFHQSLANKTEGAAKEEAPESKENCEKCGAPMVLRKSRFGQFLGCSNYPKCKNIKKIQKIPDDVESQNQM